MSSDLMRLAGINSGYDTEAMIEKMMSSYQTKIDNQNKKLQKLTWQQEAYRDITSKLSAFKNKYFDILKRDTYLMSPSSFNKYKTNITTKSGKESGLNVITTSDTQPGTHTLKVNSVATAAVTKGGQFSTANFKLDADKAINDAKADETTGEYTFALDVKVGNIARTIEFSGKDKDELLTSLNAELEDAFGKTSSGKAFLSASLNSDGEFAFETAGNAMATVTERTGNFGMGKPSAKVGIDMGQALTGQSSISVTVPNYYTHDAVTKNISFSTVSSTYFDGRSSDETLKQQFNELKLAAYAKKGGIDYNSLDEASKKMLEDQMNDDEKNGYAFKYTSLDAATDLNQESLLNALNSAYGIEQGVSFSINGSSVTAKYIMDGSAVEFTMTSTCEATFGLKKGSATSYVDETMKLSDLGIAQNKTNEDDEADGYSLTINGKTIEVGAKATVADLMNAVNKSDAGVTMTYSKLEGAFKLTANDKGNGADIRIDGDNTLAQALKITDSTIASHTDGTNAMIVIDGVEVEHNDNVYELDGITFDFAEVDPTEGETITVNIDKSYDDIKETIKSFVDDYNKLVDEVYNYIGTAPARDSKNNLYEPLTDAEKEEMSEKEIEKWEEKAKTGVLYNDTTVSGIMSKLRSVLYTSVELEDGTKFSLYSMGIKTASFLNDDPESVRLGKLKLDEEALDKAFRERPDAIVKLFTDSENGVMAKINNTLDNAVRSSATKPGTLVRRAGLEKGTSAKDNYIYKQMEQINKRIETLKKRYEQKENYWWDVFTNLEKMMSNMNSQMSYMQSYLASNTTTTQ